MRANALDAAFSNEKSSDHTYTGWAEGFRTFGALRGLSCADLPVIWRETLGWVGVPLVPGTTDTELRWDRDLISDPTLDVPCERDQRLHLPPPERIAAMSGVELIPIRRFIAARLGVRLQAAPNLRLWLWTTGAVVVSKREESVGGFLYAPTLTQRTSLILPPGGWQAITWDG